MVALELNLLSAPLITCQTSNPQLGFDFEEGVRGALDTDTYSTMTGTALPPPVKITPSLFANAAFALTAVGDVVSSVLPLDISSKPVSIGVFSALLVGGTLLLRGAKGLGENETMNQLLSCKASLQSMSGTLKTFIEDQDNNKRIPKQCMSWLYQLDSDYSELELAHRSRGEISVADELIAVKQMHERFKSVPTVIDFWRQFAPKVFLVDSNISESPLSTSQSSRKLREEDRWLYCAMKDAEGRISLLLLAYDPIEMLLSPIDLVRKTPGQNVHGGQALANLFGPNSGECVEYGEFVNGKNIYHARPRSDEDFEEIARLLMMFRGHDLYLPSKTLVELQAIASGYNLCYPITRMSIEDHRESIRKGILEARENRTY